MEYASIVFLWVFLPGTLLLYYGARLLFGKSPRALTAQNAVLALASLVFYAWGGLSSVALLLCLVLVNYGFGRWLARFPGEGAARGRCAVFVAGVILNVLALGFFKYFNMLVTLAEIVISPWQGARAFVVALCRFEGTGAIQVRQVVMPLAISFIAFHAISYLTDVWKGRVAAESNLLRFGLYLCMFPKMVQGPIMRYGDLGPQIAGRGPMTARQFSSGVRRFCYGLGKKVFIANTLAVAANKIWAIAPEQVSTVEAWFGVLLYTLQIYYDFSGYTDMAVGVGRMLGFELCENFNYPYTSLSVQEFWRRWHISLSNWFRDYIYIPLGGNRRGNGRTLFNLFVVFLVTGVWHGANLTFICWGLYFALLSIVERLFLGKWLRKNPVVPLNWLYTIFAVSMGWVLFRSPNLYHAFKFYRALFCATPQAPGTSVASLFSADLLFAVSAGVLFCGLVQRPLKGLADRLRARLPFELAELLLLTAILAWSIVLIVNGSYNPSIYAAF